jgi:hypothetical protein
MHKTYAALATLCLLAAVGCSGAESGDAENSESADGTSATLAQSLATVDVGDEQVTFYDDVDGGILIGSLKPNAFADFAVVQLERTAGTELTPLELFSALAPDETPPNRLVQDHTARVAGLGRADAAMLKVAFEPQHLVDKAWTSAQCDTATGLTGPVVNRYESMIAIDICSSRASGFPLGSCNAWVTTSRHRAGVCNGSSVGAITTTASSRQDNTSWASASASVPANGSYLWTSHPSLNYKLTGWQPSKLRLQAWAFDGGGFRARLAPW